MPGTMLDLLLAEALRGASPGPAPLAELPNALLAPPPSSTAPSTPEARPAGLFAEPESTASTHAINPAADLTLDPADPTDLLPDGMASVTLLSPGPIEPQPGTPQPTGDESFVVSTSALPAAQSEPTFPAPEESAPFFGNVFVSGDGDPGPKGPPAQPLSGESVPTVSILAYDPFAGEEQPSPGSTTGLFRFTRDGDTTDPLTVYFVTSGTADPGADYQTLPAPVTITVNEQPIVAYPITIEASKTTAWLTIEAVNDGAVENTVAEEVATFTLVVPDGGAYLVNAQAGADTMTIVDNDPWADGTSVVWVEAHDPTAQEPVAYSGPGTNMAEFLFHRTNATAMQDVQFTWTGAATFADDYTVIPSGWYVGTTTVRFMPGQATTGMTVRPVGDDLTEGAEDVVVTITSAGGGAIDPDRTAATAVIYDTDYDYPNPWPIAPSWDYTVGVGAQGGSVDEAGESSDALRVSWAWARIGYPGENGWVYPPPPPENGVPDLNFLLGGSGRNGLDYYLTMGDPVFTGPGTGYKDYTITALDDTEYEGTESAEFILLPTAEYALGDISGGAVGIVDDDAEPLPVVDVSAPDPFATEQGPTTGSFLITRDDTGVAFPLTVSYSMSGDATYGADYSLAGETGYFPAGVSKIEIALLPVDDTEEEDIEKADLGLAESASYTIGASPGTVNIVDNDKMGGDLDIIDSKVAVVDEDKEENPGGWVSANNDNDNYNFVGPAATSLIHKIDSTETAKVAGENDLIKIIAHDLIAPPGLLGKFTLEWSSTNIHIWKTADKDGAVASGVEVPAGGVAAYWVEGLALSSSMAAEEIKLVWTDSVAGPQELDKVNFTVYEVTGVMNVPGYSSYDYRVTVPGGTYIGQFVSVTNGSEWAIQLSGGGAVPWVTTAKILWNGGPVVGTYRVRPGFDLANFFVNREVNVVKVEMTAAAGFNNRITYRNPPEQSVLFIEVINSAKDIGPAMAVNLRVTRLEGPVVGGTVRGVRFVEIGMIQNSKITLMHSDYDGFVPAKRRICKLEGNTVWVDCYTEAGASTPPWYDSQHSTGTRGVYTHGSDPAAGTYVANIDFNITDTPRLSGTDNMALTIGAVTKNPDRFAIKLNLNLYFAVRTQEAILNSDKVFTQRGSAAWYFDGSGTIVGNTWAPIMSTKNDGSRSFVEVTNGTVVPVTTGTTGNAALTANYKLGPAGWDTVNQ